MLDNFGEGVNGTIIEVHSIVSGEIKYPLALLFDLGSERCEALLCMARVMPLAMYCTFESGCVVQ